MKIYETTRRFTEPTGTDMAGTETINRLKTPYEIHMEAQGIPIHRGPGFHDVRELELAEWDRIGARGAFLVPDNTIELLGLHIVEIPPRSSLAVQRHFYEEKYWVISGRGSTDVWLADPARPASFEWGSGALFAIPLNASFRINNVSSQPALLMAGNTAPPFMSLISDEEIIFDNDLVVPSRLDDTENYYRPADDALADPVRGRAMWKTSLIPDIVNCELPLDNQRSPGYRRIEMHMARGTFYTFIGEHQIGRYSKAHYHMSGAVLVALSGSGYTLNWPREAGVRPWESGHGDVVERVDYGPGGLVAAAPGGGDWFHQHFACSKEPLRLLVFSGGLPDRRYSNYTPRPGTKEVHGNYDIEQGGRSIGYPQEDPFIREEFGRMLAKVGVSSTMPDSLYL